MIVRQQPRVLLINDDNEVNTSLCNSSNSDIILNKDNDVFECINTFKNIILNGKYSKLKFINAEKEFLNLTINQLQPELEGLAIFNCDFNLKDINLLPKLKYIECNSIVLKNYHFNNIKELTTENININFNDLPKTIKRLKYHLAKKEKITYNKNYLHILTISIQHNKEQMFNIKNLELLDIIIYDDVYTNENNKLYGLITNINELIIENLEKKIIVRGLELKNIKNLKLINTKLYLKDKLNNNCNIILKNSKIIYLN